MERKVGGKFHLKLNMNLRPIAYKYHEGKVKSTLERELEVPEIAGREANGTSLHGKIVVRAFIAAQCVWPWHSLVVDSRGYTQLFPASFEIAGVMRKPAW